MNIDLEQTQDFKNPLGAGVWRRSSDADMLEADLEDGMRSYTPAPELSQATFPTHITRMMARQAD